MFEPKIASHDFTASKRHRAARRVEKYTYCRS
jgi:hypothetical protein